MIAGDLPPHGESSASIGSRIFGILELISKSKRVRVVSLEHRSFAVKARTVGSAMLILVLLRNLGALSSVASSPLPASKFALDRSGLIFIHSLQHLFAFFGFVIAPSVHNNCFRR